MQAITLTKISKYDVSEERQGSRGLTHNVDGTIQLSNISWTRVQGHKNRERNRVRGLPFSLVSYSAEWIQLLALQLFPYHPHHAEVAIADPCHLLCNNTLSLYRGWKTVVWRSTCICFEVMVDQGQLRTYKCPYKNI